MPKDEESGSGAGRMENVIFSYYVKLHLRQNFLFDASQATQHIVNAALIPKIRIFTTFCFQDQKRIKTFCLISENC